MPFNIELARKDNVAIKTQISGKNLVIYFQGEHEAANLIRDRWLDTQHTFAKRLPDLNLHPMNLPDSIYEKTHHTNAHELEVTHVHLEFNCEISPSHLSCFLYTFYMEQLKSNNPQYHFITEFTEIEHMIKNFSEFLKLYKGSDVEILYKEQNQLTDQERIQYEQEIKLHQEHHREVREDEVKRATDRKRKGMGSPTEAQGEKDKRSRQLTNSPTHGNNPHSFHNSTQPSPSSQDNDVTKTLSLG